MFRVLTILAAVAALAVSAAPVASAGSSKPPPSQTFIEIGTTETLDMNATGTATGHSAGMAPDFGIYLSLRKAPPKPRGFVDIGNVMDEKVSSGRGAGKVANHTEGTIRGISGGRWAEGQFVGR